MNVLTICSLGPHNLVLSVEEKWQRKIRIINTQSGNTTEVLGKCDHHTIAGKINHLKIHDEAFLESCYKCGEISVFDINTEQYKIAYKKCQPIAMCSGPDGTILVLDRKSSVLQFDLDQRKPELKLRFTISPKMKKLRDKRTSPKICYLEQQGTVVMDVFQHIRSINLSDGSALWQRDYNYQWEGLVALGSLSANVLFAAFNKRLLVLDNEMGNTTHTHQNKTSDLCVTRIDPPQIGVLYEGKITFHNVTLEVSN